IDPEIADRSRPLVAQLVAMFCETPPTPVDSDGRPRAPNRDELAAAGKLVDLEGLQREAYTLWGVKLDLETRKARTPDSVFDELSELVAHGLTEQRERLLDLMDRVISAVVEESCPANKPPEDWDWKSMHNAFREHFREELGPEIENLGDPESIPRTSYTKAEELFLQREKQLGFDLNLRVFRLLYVRALDKAWVDHLQNMEHLRD